MEQKVRAFISKHHMIQPGDRIVVGVSGGADSVCLLLLLHDFLKNNPDGQAQDQTAPDSCIVVHVEHGIRGQESLADAQFVQELCARYGILCEVMHVDVPAEAQKTGESLEEAARRLRYGALREACRKYGANRIAVAHHGNDVAETMLFQMARGSGIRGLSGISPVLDRDESGEKHPQTGEDFIPVIRPLLCVSRQEILQWLKCRGQEFRVDQTNEDVTYSRNRIRNLVVPQLEEVNPQAVAHMQKLGEQLQEICDYLDEAAWEAGRDSLEITKNADGSTQVEITVSKVRQLPKVLQKNLFHQLLGLVAGSRKDLTSTHVEQMVALTTADVGKQIHFPYNMVGIKTYETIILRTEAGSGTIKLPLMVPGTIKLQLMVPGTVKWGEKGVFVTEILENEGFTEEIPDNTYTKWFDYDKIKGTVQLRGRESGDYLQTTREGGHKKLKNYFIDEKIPQEERDSKILLADGSHIMWVVGHRISQAYKVTEETKRILQVHYEER